MTITWGTSLLRNGLKALAKFTAISCAVIQRHKDKMLYVLDLMVSQNLITTGQRNQIVDHINAVEVACPLLTIVAKAIDNIDWTP